MPTMCRANVNITELHDYCYVHIIPTTCIDVYTHRPDASSECHGVGNSTGYAGRAKAEIIISHLSSCVPPQWTVASVVIVRGSSVSETESEIVVTLATKQLTATTRTLPVVAVSVGVRSDFKHIGTFCKLLDQEFLCGLQCRSHNVPVSGMPYL